MKATIHTLTIQWRDGRTVTTAYGSAGDLSAALLAVAEECHDESISPETPDDGLIAIIGSYDHEVTTDTSEIDIENAIPAPDAKPEAIYDAAAQTLTCPHCGYSGPVHDWTLIETGYTRHWELSAHDDDGDPEPGTVSAFGDTFGDDGDGYELAHYDAQTTAPGCYKSSAIPDAFAFDF